MTFYEVLTAAINDIIEHGFDTEKRVEDWVKKLKDAAIKSLVPEHRVKQEMEKALNDVYARLVTNGGIVKANKSLSKFNIDKVRPKLRRELDRRIMASANLIKLNREESISNTLRRFQGWATAIPVGGSKAVDKVKEKQHIRKSLSRLPFEERRVVIDQAHKLASTINDIVAVDNGAIAAEWNSHWRQPGYNYRKDHKERDKKIYLIRGNWASQKRLIKAKNGYTDQITQPGEEVFCRCNYKYLYNLRQLPDDMLTNKGKIALESSKIQAR